MAIASNALQNAITDITKQMRLDTEAIKQVVITNAAATLLATGEYSSADDAVDKALDIYRMVRKRGLKPL